MTDTTPGCGSTTDARKRLAEKASTPDDRDAVAALAEAFKIGWHRADDLGLPDRTHYGIRELLASEAMAEHVAQVRRETAEKIVEAVWTHADHMAGYTLPVLSSGFIEGYTHALNLLRRDAGFIARQSVESGGEDA